MRTLVVALVILLILPSTKVKADTPLSGFSVLLEDVENSDFYNEDDLNLLAEVMYHENFCNGEYIMLLTGSVVLNRRDYCSWCPNTIEKVLYQKGQYSTVKKFFTVKIPDSVYALAKQLLIFGSIAPENVVFQAMFKQGSGVYYSEKGEYFCYE